MSDVRDTARETRRAARAERRSERTGLAGALILIGIGILMITGWWWPGIMVVLGVAFAAERLVAGRVVDAVVVLAIFLGIPVAISLMTSIDIPWAWVVGLVLIGIGGAAAVRALAGEKQRNP